MSTPTPGDVREIAYHAALQTLGEDGEDAAALIGEDVLTRFRAALQNGTNGTEPWPDEEPDVPGEVRPEALPLDALPPALRAHVSSVARSLQVPADLRLMLGLGTLSAAVAGRVEVAVRPGWREPVGIYTAAILPPASRKSPAYDAMTAPLRAWEADEVRRRAPLVLADRDAVDVAEKCLERMKNDAAKPPPKGKTRPAREEIEDARRELEEIRAAVRADGRLLAGDITPEAMVKRMADQGGRLAILEPEPGPLQLLAGRYSESARLDEIKKAWSGEAITVDRVGRAPLRVERPALTLALCLQPGVLSRLENREAFRGEGVLGRFLWVQPPHGLGTRRTGPDVPPLDTRARAAYEELLNRLLPSEDAQGRPGEELPDTLRLSEGALDVLHEFEAEVEPQLADGARCEPIRDWAGKCVGQTVRVAALLQLAENAGRGQLGRDTIGVEAMESAVRIMRALTTHALAVLGPVNFHESLLAYVLRRAAELVNNPPEDAQGGASLRNLYERTKGRSAIESVEDLQTFVDDLVDRGCLRLLRRTQEGPGRPPSPIVEINPRLPDSIRTIRTNVREEGPDPISANTANVSHTPSAKTEGGAEEGAEAEIAAAPVDELLDVEARS